MPRLAAWWSTHARAMGFTLRALCTCISTLILPRLPRRVMHNHWEGMNRMRYHEEFRKLDKDHSGTIEKEEMRAALQVRGCCFRPRPQPSFALLWSSAVGQAST